LRLVKQAAGIAVRNGKYWIAALLLRGRTDRRSLQIQIGAAQTFSRLKYVIRLAHDKNFRKLVLKENWLEDSSTLPSKAGLKLVCSGDENRN
jgi:hypothetical protein